MKEADIFIFPIEVDHVLPIFCGSANDDYEVNDEQQQTTEDIDLRNIEE
jgi:hypothetical protein